jgi:hypothetical protein
MKTTIKKPIIPGVGERMNIVHVQTCSVKYNSMILESPIKSIESEYHFDVNPMYLVNAFNMTGVMLENYYGPEDQSHSSFILSPEDAIRLGNSIIDTANKCAEYNKILYNRDKMVNILKSNIEKGYVDTLVIKYHKKCSMEINNPYTHIYNIYPIYKEKIKNNHFNFNIPLTITDFTTIDGTDINPSDLIRGMNDSIYAMFCNRTYYSCLSEEENKKLDEMRKFKIKFANMRKVIERDYNTSVIDNKRNKEKYKENQKLLLNNAQYAAERDARLAESLKDVPRDKNGRINFTEAVKAMGIKLDFNGKK